MHYVKPSEAEKANKIGGHLELCTASRGSCHFCRARLAGEVLIQESQPYHLGPALVRKGDRGKFEQKVVMLTAKMRTELCAHLGETGWRGNRFDLLRSSPQKYKITPAAKSHTQSAKLPAPFAVLPFVRARWELGQDPANPLAFLPSYSFRDLTAGVPERARQLALSASDCQTAEEQAKVREKLAAAKERFGVAKPQPAPAPAPADAATPPPVSVTVLVSGADVPVPEGTELPKPGKIFLVPVPAPIESDRDRRRRAAETGGSDNAVSLGDEFAHILPLNGKHETKKGGSK